MSGANLHTFTDASFDSDVLNADVPVLVDFWAEWCGPCRMIAPTIEAIAEEYAGKAKVGKLNVDHNPATAGRFRVQSIPTLLVFKAGAVADQIVGLVGKDKVQSVLNRHIGA